MRIAYALHNLRFGEEITMESLKLRRSVGVDGILHLDVPVGWQDAQLEVTVMIEPVKSTYLLLIT